MGKKIMVCTMLTLIGAGVVAMVLVNKKTRKKAAALIETVIDETEDMILM